MTLHAPFSLVSTSFHLLLSVLKWTTLAGVTWVLWYLFEHIIWYPLRSPLRSLKGPPPTARLFSNHMPVLTDPHRSKQTHEDYRAKYGLTSKFHGSGVFDERILTFDPVTINYILGRAAEIYPKPMMSRRFIAKIVGDGVFVAEGEEHRKQRKVILPAFSAQALKDLQPIFFEKAVELRRAMESGFANGDAKEFDLHNLLWRTTFDVIGSAGFSYAFDCIKDETNPMYKAYKYVYHIGLEKSIIDSEVMKAIFPWTRWFLPSNVSAEDIKQRKVVNKAGRDILQRKLASAAGAGDKGKDMLSLLVKANLSQENKEDRLDDDSLLTQINTLLFVGSDSTSLALGWTLHLLTEHPEIQQRLRDEIIGSIDEKMDAEWMPSMAQQMALQNLPYLEYVVKESLRLMPPVHCTLRCAAVDDYLPMSDGSRQFIHKGQVIHIAIEGFNTRKDVWGEDSFDFKPERWANLPRAAKEMPGLVQGLMTFSLGPHSCPGYKFALLEMKAVLGTLIPAFAFDKAPNSTVLRWNGLMVRPIIREDVGRIVRLPMIVKRSGVN